MTWDSWLRRAGLLLCLLSLGVTVAHATEIKLQHPSGVVTDVSNRGASGAWVIEECFPDGTVNETGTEPPTMTLDQVVRALTAHGDSVTVDGAPYTPGMN
ncbi:MAG TPA: hypothetical protein PK231_13345 [Acidocella sp.]|jgi:hypothetical protein|nr:MAG: hypothetical protein B7Z77_08790 [Acidocella sp. 20-58-15]HQT40410.1 hypothetical protein [Acidocella sp.]